MHLTIDEEKSLVKHLACTYKQLQIRVCHQGISVTSAFSERKKWKLDGSVHIPSVLVKEHGLIACLKSGAKKQGGVGQRPKRCKKILEQLS
jgi:hypothetical protein